MDTLFAVLIVGLAAVEFFFGGEPTQTKSCAARGLPSDRGWDGPLRHRTADDGRET